MPERADLLIEADLAVRSRRRYVVHGVHVEVSGDDPEALERVHALLEHFGLAAAPRPGSPCGWNRPGAARERAVGLPPRSGVGRDVPPGHAGTGGTTAGHEQRWIRGWGGARANTSIGLRRAALDGSTMRPGTGRSSR